MNKSNSFSALVGLKKKRKFNNRKYFVGNEFRGLLILIQRIMFSILIKFFFFFFSRQRIKKCLNKLKYIFFLVSFDVSFGFLAQCELIWIFFFFSISVTIGVSWEEWWTYDGISGKEIIAFNEFYLMGILNFHLNGWMELLMSFFLFCHLIIVWFEEPIVKKTVYYLNLKGLFEVNFKFVFSMKWAFFFAIPSNS